MEQITHPELVKALAKPGAAIVDSLTSERADLWHAATGVAGEATEICEALLTYASGELLDLENLIEELGDMEFYLQQLRSNVGIPYDELFMHEFDFSYSEDPAVMAGVIAICGGNILDFVKKVVVYNKDLDRAALLGVLGAMEGSLHVIRHLSGVTREQVLQANIEKLSIRYAGLSYSDDAAQTRADKA